MFEVFILSLVQGITEFLPISSSSHLILVNYFSNFSVGNLLTDTSLHVGSFLAVVIYFFKDLINFGKNKKLLFLILVSSLPVLITGYLVSKFGLIENIRTVKIIGWMTLLFGIILYISDKMKIKRSLKKEFNLKIALIIGIVHSFSIIPGVSRSGLAITISRFLGYDRYESSKISFLLSIPTLGAVSIYSFFYIYKSKDIDIIEINFAAILFSLIFSLITIKYFLRYIQKFNLNIFVFYRVLIGVLILAYAYK